MKNQFDPNNLIRENIRDLAPYSSARHEHEWNDGIFLDANENAFGSVSSGKHNRYPDPLHRRLKSAITDITGVPGEQIFIGNGSDESIDLLLRAFCEPGKDKVAIMPPTYGMYAVSARINNVEIVELPLKPDFDIDIEGILDRVHSDIKLLFICSPNNPTGNCFAPGKIETVLQEFPGIVILDEAYIDFSLQRSFLDSLDNFANLVVLQTFSKSWGMANLRLGMAFASREIIDILYRIKPPYNINGPAQLFAIEALENSALKDRMVEETKVQRQWLIDELQSLPLVMKVHPTETNFILVKILEADKVHRFLASRKIIVRNHSRSLYCEGCLRITVGTHNENRRLIGALKEFNHSI